MYLIINDPALIPVPDIELLLSECSFHAVRSSGSGGQNVNKVATKVVLVFDVFHSESLTEEQRARILEKLKSKISQEGLIVLNASTERTQTGNRKQVAEKFERLIIRTFTFRRERVPTKPTAGSKERRLKNKKETGRKKDSRSTDYTHPIIDE